MSYKLDFKLTPCNLLKTRIWSVTVEQAACANRFKLITEPTVIRHGSHWQAWSETGKAFSNSKHG